MNLVLFEDAETGRPLPPGDPRARHIRDVLARGPGQPFDCGRVDGPRGKAVIDGEDAEGLHLAFTWEEVPPPPLPAITLLVGLPRPQTARKILVEATTLGVARMVFFSTGRGEASYAQSSLWTTGEVRRHLLAGAAQAFCTRLPEVALAGGLPEALAPAAAAKSRVALDNYEADAPLATGALAGLPAALAVGPERGWSAAERTLLRGAGFTLMHLGPRVLRSETACVAGLTLLRARLETG